MRSEGYGFVCVSVNRDLTSGASVRRPEVKILVWISLKLLRCRDTPLPAIVRSAFWKPRMRMIKGFAHAWRRGFCILVTYMCHLTNHKTNSQYWVPKCPVFVCVGVVLLNCLVYEATSVYSFMST